MTGNIRNDINALLQRGANQIAASVPAALRQHLTPERYIRMTLTALNATPGLMECVPESIAASVVEASQLGLEIDGVLGHGYLVPRYSKKLNAKVAHFQVGYRGMITLAMRSPEVESIDAEAVFEGDKFEYAKGLQPVLLHVPNPDNASLTQATLTHAWACLYFVTGGTRFKVLNKAQIEALRARSDSPNRGPWVTDYAPMACSKAIRQLLKLADLSPAVTKHIGGEEQIEAGGDPVDIVQPNHRIPQGATQAAIGTGSEPDNPPAGDKSDDLPYEDEPEPGNPPAGDKSDDLPYEDEPEPAPARTQAVKDKLASRRKKNQTAEPELMPL